MQPQDLWQLFNLRDTPFFQEALRPGSGARYPVEWCVGRDAETNRVVRMVLGHAGSSRQSIRGAVGVGKSTLAQYVKAALAERHFYSTADAVALGHADNADEVCVRILSYVYEALLAVAQDRKSLGAFEKEEAVQSTRQLVRVFRETSALSGGVTAPLVGGGVSLGRTTARVTPGSARPSIVAGQLLRELMHVARTRLAAKGMVVHVNNLENLSDGDTARAGMIFRDLRDPCLLADGYHWIVVGTNDALRTVIDSHAQLRSVFSLTLALEPLSAAKLLDLLDLRYSALAVDTKKPSRAPVVPEAVQALYTLFRGDLRGTLAALDEAAHGLLGYGERGPDAPLTLNDIQPYLRRRYAEDAEVRLPAGIAKSLETLVQRTRNKPFTGKEAATLLKRDQSWTSRMLVELQKAGYVLLLDERPPQHGPGRPAAVFGFNGAAQLAFFNAGKKSFPSKSNKKRENT